MIPVEYYLYLSAFLFCLGVFALITRRNSVIMLIGIELILNAANLNFIAFSQYDPVHQAGQMSALFVMVLAAAEAAVGLAIILNVYKRYKTVNIDEINTLKE